MTMHRKLCHNITTLADAFNEGRKAEGLQPLADSSLSKLVANQYSGFIPVAREAGETSFTVSKYDSVVAGFAAHWPRLAKWPRGIERPEVETAE